MRILGIETSCDETAVALVEDGRRIVANLIASQMDIHALYGGVVPELASRAHIVKLLPLVEETLRLSNLTWNDVDAIAVTLGPGLIGSLLVGVETAKTLAWFYGKPLIPVHHIAAHLYTPFLKSNGSVERSDMSYLNYRTNRSPNESPSADSSFDFPYLGLVVSGGHSSLVLCRDSRTFEVLGQTVDDAAGEAFDKAAKLLELGYPGGPLVDRLAADGNPKAFAFTRPRVKSGQFDFSFSGLKTALLREIKSIGLDRLKSDSQMQRDLCASFQATVVDTLLRRAERALESTGLRRLAIVGGVACNRGLRSEADRRFIGCTVVIPDPILCTDNAAMIAGLGFHWLDRAAPTNLSLNARSTWPLPKGAA